MAEIGTTGPRPTQRRMSLHEEIVVSLRDMILDGALQPGQWIPELKLCADLAISRTPLREALKVLASDHLVTLMPNRGAVVTGIVPSEIADLFEVMDVLEAAIGRLVAARASDADVDAVETMHNDMVEHHRRGDRPRYFAINQAIHQRFADLTGNRSLAATYAGFAGKIRRARSLANLSDARWAESVQEHQDFTAALVRRDAETFASLLQSHSRRTAAVVCTRLDALAEAPRGDRKTALR